MTTPRDFSGRFDPHDDDPLAARLRAALTSEADMVQPSDDGLQHIRAGIDAEARPWYRHPGVLAVAAAVVLGLAVGAGFAFLGGDDERNPVTAATDGATAEPSDSQSPSPTPSETDSATPIPVEGDVYVYYLMDGGRGPRLYREQRPNPGMDPVTAALSTMLAEPAIDPDYTSAWPTGTQLLGYSVQGDTATVDLSDFVSAGAAGETAAVQEVVYTVTANDKAVRTVRLLVQGKAPSSGHHDWSEPVARAPMLDVQGLIWLLSPTEGATASSPVTFTGYGTAFEATISWDLRQGSRADGKVLAEGTVMGGSNGEFGDFTGDLGDLAPGTYTLRVLEHSAEDGSEQNVDTKTFTVLPSPTPVQ